MAHRVDPTSLYAAVSGLRLGRSIFKAYLVEQVLNEFYIDRRWVVETYKKIRARGCLVTDKGLSKDHDRLMAAYDRVRELYYEAGRPLVTLEEYLTEYPSDFKETYEDTSPPTEIRDV